jgi:hypothetical protein
MGKGNDMLDQFEIRAEDMLTEMQSLLRTFVALDMCVPMELLHNPTGLSQNGYV